MASSAFSMGFSSLDSPVESRRASTSSEFVEVSYDPEEEYVPVTAEMLKVEKPQSKVAASSGNWMQTRTKRYEVALMKLVDLKVGGRDVSYLRDQVESASLKEALNVVNWVKNFRGVSQASEKKCYLDFLEKFRLAACELKDDTITLDTKVVHELALKHFTIDIKDTVIGTGFIDRLLASYTVESVDDLDANQLQKALESTMKGMSIGTKAETTLRKLSAINPAGSWDPAEYSIRSKFATLTVNNKEVTMLRTACPVVGANAAPEIDPVFLAMLRGLKAEGKKYLYINNQSADKTSDSRKIENECESNRVKALQTLSQSEEFKDVFQIVSFAHDSNFYKGKSDVETIKFIEEFCTYLIMGKQGYFLPEHLHSEEETSQIHDIIYQVARDHFTDSNTGEIKEVLKGSERKIFLHLAYAAISKYILEALKIDFFNITCKDGVDRAAGSAANLIAYNDPQADIKDLVYILSFPAVLNHARPPREDRHAISITTLKMIKAFQASHPSSEE